MVSRILHVVVGSGNVPYFINAIRSILDLDAGDVFAAYNFISEDDRSELKRRKHEIASAKHLEVFENDTTLRTGSLYLANNAGLSFGRGNYDFVSFVQADMQLMWWNEKILDRSRDIVDSLGSPARISFYTQLPILGKHSRPYERWDRNDRIEEFSSFGHVDVCLLPIYDSLNSEFRFEGSEESLSNESVRNRDIIILHPFPFIAPIPFPATVRDRRVHQSSEDRRNSYPILKVEEGYSPNFMSTGLHPISMEQTIRPNGWACLFPYWPSDLESRNWLPRHMESAKIVRVPVFSVKDATGQLRRWFMGALFPSRAVILASTLIFVARELRLVVWRKVRLVRRILRT